MPKVQRLATKQRFVSLQGWQHSWKQEYPSRLRDETRKSQPLSFLLVIIRHPRVYFLTTSLQAICEERYKYIVPFAPECLLCASIRAQQTRSSLFSLVLPFLPAWFAKVRNSHRAEEQRLTVHACCFERYSAVAMRWHVLCAGDDS